MKFRDLAKGTRATVRADLPHPQAPEGKVGVLVRVLFADERAQAVSWGREYAKKRGLARGEAGDEEYDIGMMAATAAQACYDLDKPDEPFFVSPDEAIAELHPDTLAWLYETWQAHQDAHSPLQKELSPGEFVRLVVEAAGEPDPKAWRSLAPATQWSSFRTLAGLYLNSQTPKSPSSSDTEGFTGDTTKQGSA